MPDLSIDFTWFRDPKGYRLIPAKPVLRRGQSILDVPGSDIQPARIVRNGGALQAYRPFNVSSKLFENFINAAKTEIGVLEFVKLFGPLTRDGLRGKGDVVHGMIDQAEDMTNVLRGRIFGRFLAKLNVSISSERNGIHLKVEPPDLLSALWLQVAQAGRRRVRECEQCHNPILGRRADARFCSDPCRIKYNSLERSR
jgi:hypothetical protein